MNKEQKLFMSKTLPDFILREQGRGFAMATWKKERAPGQEQNLDHVIRSVPPCGTIACLGGSAGILLGLKEDNQSCNVIPALGLTYGEGRGLFFSWYNRKGERYSWPPSFAERYRRARSTVGKARIAAELCKLVAKTNGKCLHRKVKKGKAA